METNLIPAVHYHKQEIFEEELENVFRKNWLFGCMVDDVPQVNDYYVLNIGKHSVIFYNSGDGIVALQNVCPHRFNRIFKDQKGNGPLKCAFHSWKFDNQGTLKTRVCAPESVGKYSLKKYASKVIGAFVFFHFDAEPEQDIYSQFGNFIEELELVSGILGNKIHEDYIAHEVNWKIICENIIEISHCSSLHKESLVKIGYCKLPVEEFGREGNNSFMIVPPLEDEERQKRDKFFHKNLPRKIEENKYKHSLYFPTFTIGMYEGLNITIGNIIPINSKQSVYRVIYFTSKLETDKALSQNILASMAADTISFGTQVFNEDKEIIEQIQRGVEEAPHDGMVYDTDVRVLWFMESYLKMMSNYGKF